MVNDDLNDKLDAINQRIEKLNFEVGKLIGSQKVSTNLIKYVILPLICILAGLVGIKITL